MHSKAYDLKFLLNTYLMVLRPLENFLPEYDVTWIRFCMSQKVLKIMDFGSRYVPLGSLWEGMGYVFDQDFTLNRNASELSPVATNHANYRASETF